MFPQILCDVAHNQQISIICQPPGKLCSREMLSEKRASEGANDERYGINISVCWTVWLHRSDHEKPPNPCIVNYHYQHLWLTAPSCWTDLTAGRAHAVLCPLKKSMAYSFLNICTKKQFTPKKICFTKSTGDSFFSGTQEGTNSAIFNAITNNSTLLNIKSGFIDELKSETVKIDSKCNESHA